MGIYEKNIVIRGSHATRMKALAASFDENLSQGLFSRNLDVYLVAPIVGKIYGRKADANRENDDSTTIHTEQLNREMDNLLSNYRMLALLENADSIDIDTRLSNAFRYDRDDEKREKTDAEFDQYLRGGIDVLYEKLMLNAKTTDDYVINAFEFIEDFHTHFKDLFDFELIEGLCASVK